MAWFLAGELDSCFMAWSTRLCVSCCAHTPEHVQHPTSGHPPCDHAPLSGICRPLHQFCQDHAAVAGRMQHSVGCRRSGWWADVAAARGNYN